MEGRIIVVTSGKGGVGKTTATLNIGAALALQQKRVAVVDMDIGLRNLDVVMGLENRIVFTVVDAIKGKCKIKQAAIKDRRIQDLYLIPASQSDNKDVIDPEGVVRLCKQLSREFDYILMDCPAGIERGFQNAVAPANEAVVICTPEVSSVRDADRVIGLLHSRAVTPRLVVNRIVPDMVEKGDMMSHEDIMEILSIELLGLVPMDERVVISTNTGVPLVLEEGSSAGEAFKRIAMRLNGAPGLPFQVPRVQRSIWRKLISKFGSKN